MTLILKTSMGKGLVNIFILLIGLNLALRDPAK